MANAIINRSSVMGLSLLMSEYGRRAQVSSRHNFQDICKIVYAVYRCGGERKKKLKKSSATPSLLEKDQYAP